MLSLAVALEAKLGRGLAAVRVYYILIPEWASTEDPAQPNRKAQWISDARALFKKPGWEGFKGVLSYNKSSKYPNCRWFVDSSQASLAAFAAMANDVHYTRDEP